MQNYKNPYPSVMAVAKRPDICFVRGKGSWLWDSHGKAYLDFVQGWAVNCLGHCPDVISEAVCRQAETLIHAGPGFFNEPMIRLADALTDHSCFDQVFFTNNGAEANEGAIKLARKWGSIFKQGAFEIITLEHGFHGRTLATMSASGKKEWKSLYAPEVPGFIKVAQNNIAAVEQAINANTVAIMLEPIQGESGVHPATREYLHSLRSVADKHGLLLIFDEVQTGMGRTGSLFAYEQSGVQPDIMTLGKGLGGGIPIAAMMIKKQFSCFDAGDQGGTFNGNPLVTAVSHAVLETLLTPGFLQHVNTMGKLLMTGLKKLSTTYSLGKLRGQGLLIALDTGVLPAEEIVNRMLDTGVIINAPRQHTLRFVPALNVQQQEIKTMLDLLDKVFATITGTGSNHESLS